MLDEAEVSVREPVAKQRMQQACTAAKAAAAGASDGCPFCMREGLAIMPVRYAVMPKKLPACTNNFAGQPTLGHGITDKALVAHQYTLRTLRQGFVHVWLGEPGVWQVYAVTTNGCLRLLPDPDNIDNKTDEGLSPQCERAGHNVPASFIRIKDIKRTPTVWVAFADNPWPKKVRQAYEAAPESRMQRVDCVTLASHPDQYTDAFEIAPHADLATERDSKLAQLVTEFARPINGVWTDRLGYSAYSWLTDSPQWRTWNSRYVFGEHSDELEGFHNFATAHAERDDCQGKVAGLALHDPVGIVSELNTSRLKVIAECREYQRANARAQRVSQSIQGLKQFFEKKAEAAHAGEDNIQLEAQWITEVEDPDNIVPTMGYGTTQVLVKTTRAERVEADFQARWDELNNHYDEAARAAFAQRYEQAMTDYRNRIAACGADWAAWAGDPAWTRRFYDYNPEQAKSRRQLICMAAPCLAGGPTDKDSFACWQQWLTMSPKAEHNPTIRALFGNKPDIIEALAHDEEGAGGTLYGLAKSLARSEEMQRYVDEHAREAIADIQNALTGAVSRVGDQLTGAARLTVLHAQQAAVQVYTGAEVTMIEIGMRVDDYRALLDRLAFDPLRQTSVQTLERGERTIRSIAVAGVLSVDNPALQKKIVNVVLVTTDSIDDIKAAIQKLAGSTARTADEALGRIRIPRASLNRSAAAALEGLRIPTGRVFDFTRVSSSNSVRLLRNGGVILGAGMLGLQVWSLRHNLEKLDDTIGHKHNEAWAAVASNTLGVLAASTELYGLGRKAWLKGAAEAGETALRLAAWMGVVTSVFDGMQAFLAYKRTSAKGDGDAASYYNLAMWTFAAAVVPGGIAAATTSTVLLGPFGIALALVVAGAVLVWLAVNAEDTQAAIWLDRCYFGNGDRTAGKWTDAEINKEMAQLNAILVGMSGQVGFNDNMWGIEEQVTGFDMVEMELVLGHFDADHSAYEWQLEAQRNNGDWWQGLAGDYRVPQPLPAMSAMPANVSQHAPWIKSYDTTQSRQGDALIIRGSVDVNTEQFEKVRLTARYWLNYADRAAEAQINISQKDGY